MSKFIKLISKKSHRLIKVVFVIESLDIGGAEKSLTSLLQALDFTRYKVDLIIFKPYGHFTKFVPPQVEIIQRYYPKINLLNRAKFYFQRKTKPEFHSAQLFWNIIKDKFKYVKSDKKYDVAIAYSQGFSTYYTERYIRADKKLAWLNTDYSKAGYNIKYDYPIYKNFDVIVAVSAAAKDVLKTELEHIKKDLNVLVVKDIVDPEILLRHSELEPLHKFNQNRINIVSVGRLENVKGFTLAIEACKILVNKGHSIMWYLIGEGQERKKLETLIQNYDLSDHFILVGENPNPYPYMARSDIYVQTSAYEGLGLTIIEAASLCKPIVCTNFPSANGILEDEKTGLIVSMEAQSIAAGIIRLIEDTDLRTQLIRNLSRKENKSMANTLSRIDVLLGTKF